jgi:hypothetical protein
LSTISASIPSTRVIWTTPGGSRTECRPAARDLEVAALQRTLAEAERSRIGECLSKRKPHQEIDRSGGSRQMSASVKISGAPDGRHAA